MSPKNSHITLLSSNFKAKPNYNTLRLARIILNENNWEQPSGSQQVNGIVRDQHFGYEEWLNNNHLMSDEFRFGFIEAFRENVPRGNFDLIILFTYLNGEFRICGYIKDIIYLDINERIQVINNIWMPNFNEFNNHVQNIRGRFLSRRSAPQNTALNFKVKKNNLNVGTNQINLLEQFPSFNQYLKDHRFFRLSKMYYFPERFRREMEEIVNAIL